MVPKGSELEPDIEYHFVVMTDGSLRAMPTDDLMAIANDTGFGPSGVASQISGGAGHVSLAGGASVHMAGLFDTNAAAEISTFRSFSGHYMPYSDPGYTPVEQITIAAFAGHELSMSPDITYLGRGF